MGKGDADIYQSPYQEGLDTLGMETVLGVLSGQGIDNSPTATSMRVAQTLGGTFDSKNQTIKMQDGSVIKYDPLTNQFKQLAAGTGSGANVGGAGNWQTAQMKMPNGKTRNFKSRDEFDSYINSGGVVYSGGQPVTDLTPYIAASNITGKASDYLARANQINQTSGAARGAADMFNVYSQQVYNPATGQYEMKQVAPQGVPAGMSRSGKPLTGQGRLNEKIRTLFKGDAPTDTSAISGLAPAGPRIPTGADYLSKYGSHLDQAYKPADYQALTPISDRIRSSIYQKGADRIATNFRDTQAENEKFISAQGSNLGSGRAAGLNRELSMQKGRELQGLGQDVDTQFGMLDYEDQKAIREKKAEENRYGFESGQQQGTQKLGIVEGIDASNRDRAFQELQADRQQKLNQLSAMQELMRIYGGQDATAAQYAAAQSGAVGSALGGLFTGAGAVGGGFAGG